MKIVKILLISAILLFTFSGCQNQDNVKDYNQISEEHNIVLNEATNGFGSTIDQYNSQDYDKAMLSAKDAKEKFEAAKILSEKGKNIAEKIKDKEWLADFKQIYVQMEELRIEQCDYLIQSAQAAKNQDITTAQEQINKMSELNVKYQQMQNTLNDIKAQHPQDFE